MQTPAPRVLILTGPPLFAQALRQLVEDGGSTVVGVEPLSHAALERVQAARPNIIIVDNEDISPQLLSKLWESAPTVRVICLALEDNLLRVYDRHQLSAHHAQDLTKILDIPERASQENAAQRD